MDELREKRQKEKSHRRIKHVGQYALAKRSGGCRSSKLRRQAPVALPLQKHFDPKKNKISAANQFNRTKRHDRGSENRGKSKRRGGCVKDTADRDSECRRESSVATLRDATAEDVSGIRSGREIQQESAGQEQREIVDTKHL